MAVCLKSSVRRKTASNFTVCGPPSSREIHCVGYYRRVVKSVDLSMYERHTGDICRHHRGVQLAASFGLRQDTNFGFPLLFVANKKQILALMVQFSHVYSDFRFSNSVQCFRPRFSVVLVSVNRFRASHLVCIGEDDDIYVLQSSTRAVNHA